MWGNKKKILKWHQEQKETDNKRRVNRNVGCWMHKPDENW